MGKVKKSRQKLHLKAVKFGQDNLKKDPLQANESSLPSIFPTSGLFAAVDTSKREEEKSGVANSTKPQKVSKTDKRKERHVQFLKKLHAGKLVEESIKKAEKRAQTAIVGDIEPLLSSLPVIRLAAATNQEGQNSKSQRSNCNEKTMKRRKKSRLKSQLADIKQFQQVVKHPAYQANPIDTITEHIHNIIARENELNTR
ncbi:ribosome biogenesis protein slx9 [Nematostella vectensis]|uniref:ribosome biogenesis protein slx9 n=1 Tax=Nematostella vectensis TaxID=45351 RepID=UPI00138FE698|nr:ribosome biogenesis protein slx9 [Nematostella vectensis]